LKVKTHIGAVTLPMAMLYTVTQKDIQLLAYTLGDLSTNNTESKKGEGKGIDQ